MPRKLFVMDCSEANYTSAVFHVFSAIIATIALMSNEWIIVNSTPINGTTEEASLDMMFDLTTRTEKCEKIGCFDFWQQVRFGGFFDPEGKQHVAFHSRGRVLIDCITPLVANIFYVIIALCFVISMTAILSAALSICPPPNPFLHWLKKNTLPEMCNMVLALICCVMALMAQSEVASIRDDDDVSLGCGVFLICFSGLFSFAAAAAHLRHTTKLNRMRRMDNQRMMCSRSLRSWRDAVRRNEDTMPIVDFERYLDSATSLNELPTTQQS